MLVLSRKVGEGILIGDRIAVTVLRINGPTVRLGIEAPPDVTVLREQLADQPTDQSADPATDPAVPATTT
jgi:carbon storage regulator